jgi:hypothetical protein
MNIRFRIPAATHVLLCIAVSIGAGKAAAQVPPPYQDLYDQLDGKLTDIDAYLKTHWDGTRRPVVWSAELITANGNRGEDLLKPNTIAAVGLLLDRFVSMGVRGVKVSVCYPLFKTGFPRRDEYIAFYTAVAREVRLRNISLHVQCTTVFPDTNWSRLGVDYSGLMLAAYKTELRQHVETALAAMRPDWLSVFNEPMTQKMNTGLNFTVSAVSDLVTSVLAGLDRGTTRIGAGAGTWDDPAYAQALAATSLDFLDAHIYPINGALFIDRAVTFAATAAAAGKRVVISESGLYKVRDTEVGNSTATAPQYNARDVFSFWQPLDIRFLDALARYAQMVNAEMCSFFWVRNFYASLDYDAAKASMTPTQLFALCDAEAARNILSNTLSPTGTAYKNLIGRYTTPIDALPTSSKTEGIVVFPQPAHQRLFIERRDRSAAPVLITIADVLGRVVTSVPCDRIQSAASTIPVDIESLQPGANVLAVSTAHGTATRVFVAR